LFLRCDKIEDWQVQTLWLSEIWTHSCQTPRSYLLQSLAIVEVEFKFEEDLDLIRSFIGIADYFKTVVLEEEDEFYIPHENLVFKLSG